jgi:hypothetical protein
MVTARGQWRNSCEFAFVAASHDYFGSCPATRKTAARVPPLSAVEKRKTALSARRWRGQFESVRLKVVAIFGRAQDEQRSQLRGPRREANAKAIAEASRRKHGICRAVSWRGIFCGRNWEDSPGEQRHSFCGRVDPRKMLSFGCGLFENGFCEFVPRRLAVGGHVIDSAGRS